VDPSFLDATESTGGQLFLFQKNEVAQTSLVMNVSHTHPATVLRVVGNLSGTRDLEFPVDSSIESLLLLVSLQCRNAIRISQPTGSEMTEANSALSVELAAGRILRIDHPDTGQWRVRLTGTGLFVLSVLAKADIALTRVAFFVRGYPSKEEEHISRLRDPLLGVRQDLEIQLSGQISHPSVHLVDATGGRILDMEAPEQVAEGVYRTSLASQAERYRILVTGDDASARPFQRMSPVLFHAQPAK